MLKTAEKPSQLLRRFDFFEGSLHRIVHQPDEQLLELVALPVLDSHGGKAEEASFLRLLFVGVCDYERTGDIAEKFYPTDRPLHVTGAPEEPAATFYLLRVRGHAEARRAELTASGLGDVCFRFDDMLWDVRRGRWTKDAQGNVIAVDAETGGQFDFYEPFPDG